MLAACAANGGESQSVFRNFPPAPVPEGKEFSFVHITDLHVKSPERQRYFIDDIKRINSLPGKPVFVVVTGDMVSDAKDDRQNMLYNEAAGEFKLPLCEVMGNHDKPVEKYLSFHGKDYSSFDLGGRHFVSLGLDSSRYSKWLKDDLDALPRGKEVIVFKHHPPERPLLDLLSRYNTKAIFNGHWHSNKTFFYGKIMVVSTPSLLFGGIDCNPRGFRVVTVAKDGSIKTDCRWAGLSRHLFIIAPTGGVAKKGERTITVMAGVYDDTMRIASVACRMAGGEWKPMAHVGGWLWQADIDAKRMPEGRSVVCVKVTSDSGVSWSAEKTFDYGSDDNSPFHLAWHCHAGDGTGMSSPLVVNDRLYIGIQDDNNAADGGVLCLDRRSGKIIWRFRTGESVNGAPAVSDGILCVVSVTGAIYGLDAENGRELWRNSLGNSWERWVYNSPIIDSDIVYCGVAACFAAMDLKTGKDIWRQILGGDPLSCRTSPAADADNIYVGFNSYNGLFALEKTTGAVVWNKKEGFMATHHFSALADGGLLYYSADSKLYALAKGNGREAWRIDNFAASSCVIKDSMLVACAYDGKITAFDKKNGGRLWDFQSQPSLGSFAPYARGGSQIMGVPGMHKETIYAGASDGNLYALDCRTGNKIREYAFGIPILSRPAICGNMLYVAAYDGNIFAFRTAEK